MERGSAPNFQGFHKALATERCSKPRTVLSGLGRRPGEHRQESNSAGFCVWLDDELTRRALDLGIKSVVSVDVAQ